MLQFAEFLLTGMSAFYIIFAGLSPKQFGEHIAKIRKAYDAEMKK